MIDVTTEEAAGCSTKEQWAKLFIAKNPSAHAFDLIGVYNATDLGSRLGHFSLKEVRELQAAVGAAGPTPQKLKDSEAKAGARRAAMMQEEARLLQLTREELGALADRDLMRAVLARLGARVTGDWRLASQALPIAARHVWTVFSLDADVKNGGFDQYFLNSSGELVQDAIEGFRAMSEPKVADLVERAAATYRRKRAAAARSAQAGRDHDFDGFDTEYYASFPRDRTALARDLVKDDVAPYVRAHLADF